MSRFPLQNNSFALGDMGNDAAARQMHVSLGFSLNHPGSAQQQQQQQQQQHLHPIHPYSFGIGPSQGAGNGNITLGGGSNHLNNSAPGASSARDVGMLSFFPDASHKSLQLLQQQLLQQPQQQHQQHSPLSPPSAHEHLHHLSRHHHTRAAAAADAGLMPRLPSHLLPSNSAGGAGSGGAGGVSMSERGEDLDKDSLPCRSGDGSARSGTAYASRHQAAEQRRRTRINERLDLLRKMVPHTERSNTASFLEEVLKFIDKLKTSVIDLEAALAAARNRSLPASGLAGSGGDGGGDNSILADPPSLQHRGMPSASSGRMQGADAGFQLAPTQNLHSLTGGSGHMGGSGTGHMAALPSLPGQYQHHYNQLPLHDQQQQQQQSQQQQQQLASTLQQLQQHQLLMQHHQEQTQLQMKLEQQHEVALAALREEQLRQTTAILAVQQLQQQQGLSATRHSPQLNNLADRLGLKYVDPAATTTSSNPPLSQQMHCGGEQMQTQLLLAKPEHSVGAANAEVAARACNGGRAFIAASRGPPTCNMSLLAQFPGPVPQMSNGRERSPGTEEGARLAWSHPASAEGSGPVETVLGSTAAASGPSTCELLAGSGAARIESRSMSPSSGGDERGVPPKKRRVLVL